MRDACDMGEQLALAIDVAVVTALPRPRGLEVVFIDGIPYIDDVGDEHAFRVLGWYYGYPRCCVEAFIERDERWRATRCEWPEPRPHHPVSGHLLCLACEVGPRAPLPPRPAERYGFIGWNDAEPIFRPPSAYSWRTATA